MAIRLIVHLQALPGKQEEMISAYRKRVKEVRTESGCTEFRAFQDIEDPDHSVLIEGWESQESLTVHGSAPKDPNAVDPQSLRTAIGHERYEYEIDLGSA